MMRSNHVFASSIRCVRLVTLCSLICGAAVTTAADEPALAAGEPSVVATAADVEKATPDAANPPRPDERPRRTYMGRIVAQPMSHLGASWLIRPERNDEENALEALAELQIKSGMTVVDLGCGNGYWTLPMARACAREGTGADDLPHADGTDQHGAAGNASSTLSGQVLAVDIQPQMLQQLRQNMIREGIENVQPVLGTVDDPQLPVGEVDLVLLVDAYHEFSHPQSMLWAIRRSLKPTGVIALLEYRAEDPEVPIKPLHKMSKNQIMKEYGANKLKLVREYNELPWQHLMFFARDDSPLPEIQPK